MEDEASGHLSQNTGNLLFEGLSQLWSLFDGHNVLGAMHRERIVDILQGTYILGVHMSCVCHVR